MKRRKRPATHVPRRKAPVPPESDWKDEVDDSLTTEEETPPAAETGMKASDRRD